MRIRFYVLALASVALLATSASAQVAGVLNGRYRCVAHCFAPPGGFVFITQNGWEANVLNELGQPSRAYINYRGRVWFEAVQQGAIYFAGRVNDPIRRRDTVGASPGGSGSSSPICQMTVALVAALEEFP